MIKPEDVRPFATPRNRSAELARERMGGRKAKRFMRRAMRSRYGRGTIRLLSRGREAGRDTERTREKRSELVIITDDQRITDLDAMPQTCLRIGRVGVTFTNAFVTDPLCGPSRATILTEYAHNHEYRANQQPLGGESKFRREDRDENTVAGWMRAAGYATGLFGQYMNGYGEPAKKRGDTYVPPGWDRWFGRLGGDTGPDGLYHYNDQGVPTSYDPGELHACEVEGRKAAEWIEQREGPFFCYWAPGPPHQPATPDGRDDGIYEGVSLPEPPNFNEVDVSDKPEWVRGLQRLQRGQLGRMRNLYQRRLESLTSLDRQVRDVLAALERSGRLENTYVIFSTDHGFHLGEHRLTQGKRGPYEEDYSVPFLMRGPGIPRGVHEERYVLNNDIGPTCAAIAGAETSGADGTSLLPLFGQETVAWRDSFLYGRVNSKTTYGESQIPSYEGVRTPRHTYTIYHTDEEEVYDTHKDPYQLDNLIHRSDPETSTTCAPGTGTLGAAPERPAE